MFSVFRMLIFDSSPLEGKLFGAQVRLSACFEWDLDLGGCGLRFRLFFGGFRVQNLGFEAKVCTI